MKSNAHPSLYFSAYPLKAIPGEPSKANNLTQSVYLRSILSGTRKTVSRVRVFPMVDPYGKTHTVIKPVNRAKNVDPSGKDWFNHYE